MLGGWWTKNGHIDWWKVIREDRVSKLFAREITEHVTSERDAKD